MAYRLDGETEDEKAMLVEVIRRGLKDSSWRDIAADRLYELDTWLPWALLWNTGTHFGVVPYEDQPLRAEQDKVRAKIRRMYGVRRVKMAVLCVRALMVEYAEKSAAQAREWEDRWPMVDDGEASWLD